MSSVTPDAIAAHFVEKDQELKHKTEEIGPVRKERKELYDSLKKLLANEPDPAKQQITLADGTTLRLKSKESPSPINAEYVQAKLTQLIGLPEVQATEITKRLFEERPKKVSYSIVKEGGGPGAGAAAGSRGTKRPRKAGASE